jgi:hypothetical protein
MSNRRNKFIALPDDTNPRRAKPWHPKDITVYKDWTLIAQTLKVIEAISPTTSRRIFESLVEKNAVRNDEKGLNLIRRNITILAQKGIIIIDTSKRIRITQEYTTEALIILKPEKKYKFKGQEEYESNQQNK